MWLARPIFCEAEMKWSEFKTIVDKALDGKDPEIDYIDIGHSMLVVEDPEVMVSTEYGDLCIFN